MSDANKALAEVRSWLCNNLGSGDAGKVCGMLSVVSRRINELEDENAKLKKLVRDVYALNWNWFDCTECPWFDECRTEGGCPWLGILHDHMRELGVLHAKE